MSVYWTPMSQTRSMLAANSNSAFVFLADEAGEPIAGVEQADLTAIEAVGFTQASSTQVEVWTADQSIVWAEIGSGFPGLYRLTFPSTAFAGLACKQAVISLSVDGVADRTFLTSVEVANGSTDGGNGGGNGGEDDFNPAVIFSLLGYNAVYNYSAHDSGGRPLVGTMTLYGSRADAASETNPVGVVDLQYAYTAGKLVKVKKLIDGFSLGGGGGGQD